MHLLLTLPALLAMATGYLLGSIPFGLVLTKAAGLGDVRAIGSGNIGATNVLRTGNKALAAATLLLDALKGTAAVMLVKLGLFGPWPGPELAFLAGFGALLGHIFPVWLEFKGGKGIATYIGMLAGLMWPAAVAFCLIWLATAVLTRISSLSALAAVVLTPVAVLLLDRPEVAMLLITPSLLLIWKHRSNIQRLREGKEPKIGAKA